MAKRCSGPESQALFQQYESSNISQRVFCEQHGLREGAIKYPFHRNKEIHFISISYNHLLLPRDRP